MKKIIFALSLSFIILFTYRQYNFSKKDNTKLVITEYCNLLGNNISGFKYAEPLTKKYNILQENISFIGSFFKPIDVVFLGPGKHRSDLWRSVFSNGKKTIYFTGEPNTPDPKKWDLSMGFDYLDDENYLRYPLYFEFFAEKINLEYKREKCEPKKKKYFACFLYKNGAKKARGDKGKSVYADGIFARNEIFRKLSEYKFVASGGKYLNNIGEQIPFKDTAKWLSQCKFVIAYESRAKDGYFSEKLPQAYFSGSVPIYYGSPSYYKDVNKKVAIYQGDFKSQEDMIEYIKKVDQDDNLYCEIFNQKLLIKKEQTFEYLQTKLLEKYEKFIFPKLNKSEI